MRHAFLLMMTTLDEQGVFLINSLAHSQVDVYVNIDKKNADSLILGSEIQNDRVTFIRPIEVNWGGYSQIQAEIALLEEMSLRAKYDYVHLLSGKDALIKPIGDVVSFFEQVPQMEFVQLEERNTQYIFEKVQYRYPLQEMVGRGKNIGWAAQKLMLQIQKKIGLHENVVERYGNWYKGSQWFSITGEFAEYILRNRMQIEEVFKGKQAVDEIFIPTLLMNSSFRSRLSNSEFGNLRYIDWNDQKNSPKTLTSDDFEKIMDSGKLFARKIDWAVDKSLMEKLCNADDVNK